MTKGLRLRHLSFHSPSREPATIEFGAGLNVIYGASNTGKSFIADAIDFMLGGKGPLREIPERDSYGTVLLAVETYADEKFTIVRSTDGGAFRVYDGLHSTEIPEGDGTLYNEQHNDKRDDNLSAFLLSKLDLNHKRIRKNKRGDSQSLSFRNLARLTIVNEEEIIQQRSPLSDGNRVADTANTAVFKLLLTGVDDSALAVAEKSPEEQTKSAQMDLLDDLITEYKRKVKDLSGPPAELSEQLGKLDNSMAAQSEVLATTEAGFREISGQRRGLIKNVEEGRNRLTEIASVLDRFALLDSHYASDLERLSSIEEAGSLFVALGPKTCPLCGSLPEHQNKQECDGNAERVIAAARAEMTKIRLRRTELGETITSLKKEGAAFERRIPSLEARLSEVSQRIEQIVAPNLRRLRTSYKDLADKSGEVREALGLYRTLQDFEERRIQLEGPDAGGDDGNSGVEAELPTSAVDKFAALVQAILIDWHFPGADRVHFDLKSKDLVINGKNRTSFGKGLRAITQSAFTIGLMQYCFQNDTSHPGFALLDSPLLSYREPDSEADDLRSSDLNSRFYDYLAALPANRQVIIIENTDPPQNVGASNQTVKFTGILGQGRFGYFPGASA